MSSAYSARRDFLRSVVATTVASGMLSGGNQRAASSRLHLSSNEYSWTVFYRRENRDFKSDLDKGLADVARSGVDGLEPTFGSPSDVDRLAPLLQKNGLQLRSFYVGGTMHEAGKADRSIAQILEIAAKAKAVGARIAVINPAPLPSGSSNPKGDRELQVQAAALERLGRELAKYKLVLAYHNHDVELRQSAREFHHMMVGTDPEFVTLCLDAHWIYRGTGNSEVALFDVVKLYGRRVSELHLRQSQGGVWSETLGEGDIDYAAVASELRALGVSPHLVLEIAVEKGTPKTLDPVEAHRRSASFARRVFA